MDNIEIKDYKNLDLYCVFNSSDYRDIGDFKYGYALTCHKNGVFGYIDQKGYETLMYEYEEVGDFCHLIAPVKKNNLWGFINTSFDEVIHCKYIFCEVFKEYFIVKENFFSSYAVINGAGKIVYEDTNKENVYNFISMNYVEKFDESPIIKKQYCIPFSNASIYKYEIKEGIELIPYQNLENRDFSEGYVVIKVGINDYRIFNEKGKQLKIHTCIKLNAETMCFKKIIDRFDFRITSKEEAGYSSVIRYDVYDYIVFSDTKEELDLNKQEVLDYLKNEEKKKVKK